MTKPTTENTVDINTLLASPEDGPGADETRRLLDAISGFSAGELYLAAVEIRERFQYRGELTAEMLTALQPLLDKPMPERYVRHFPRTTGKPYPSTGLRSMQPQVNQLNAVLGRAHWVTRCHYVYVDGEMECRGWLVIGNNLSRLRLDDHGNLITNDADVIYSDWGRGSHKHGAIRGDLYKGARTNTLKRVIAEAGPGGNVYCGELDADLSGEGDEYRPPQTHERAARKVDFSIKATPAQHRFLQRIKIENGRSDEELINFICFAGGYRRRCEPGTATDDDVARALAWLPKDLVDTVRDLLAGRLALPDDEDASPSEASRGHAGEPDAGAPESTATPDPGQAAPPPAGVTPAHPDAASTGIQDAEPSAPPASEPTAADSDSPIAVAPPAALRALEGGRQDDRLRGFAA